MTQQLSEECARRIAESYTHNFGRVPRDRLFDCAARWKREYELCRSQFKHQTNLARFGFHLFRDLLTPAEIARLGSFVKGIRTWQRRVGDPTGRRMNYGVELKGPNYKVVGRTEVPPVLAEIGGALLARIRKKAAVQRYRMGDAKEGGGDDDIGQVYIQEYRQDANLGCHFDSRSAFGELIVGVSIGCESTLLLGACNGGVHVPENWETNPGIQGITLAPGTVYVLSGAARFDLRHGIDHKHRGKTRYSFTFRTVL